MKETSVLYVDRTIGELKQKLKSGRYNSDDIGRYYKAFLDIQLALDSESKIPNFGNFLANLEYIQAGQKEKIEETLRYLNEVTPIILKNVRESVVRDKTLTGRLNPSSVKRLLITKEAERLMSERDGVYTTTKY